MSRKMFVRPGMSKNMGMDTDGTISIPQLSMERLGWSIPSRVKVEYLLDRQHTAVPLTIFLTIQEDEHDQGYVLSYLNRRKNGGSGGKVRCRGLTRKIIAPRIALPLVEIVPIYPTAGLCDVVLLLSEPSWTQIDFTMAGVKSVPINQLGIYQILNNDKPFKIGQGIISARLQEHLKDERLPRGAKTARYFPVTEKSDALILEQIFLAQHENIYYSLPDLHRIRA